MPLGENPKTTPILDRLITTLDQFMPPGSRWGHEKSEKAYDKLAQRLLNDWLTRQEIEDALESLTDEYEQKNLLWKLRTGTRKLFNNALER